MHDITRMLRTMAKFTTSRFMMITILSCLHMDKALSLPIPNGRSSSKLHRLQGMFVFGTSVVDNGNNNHLIGAKGRANFLPYGIDFLHLGPTGRFTNGETIADLLGDHLKLPLLPAAFDTVTGEKEIIHGVNYGSGGSGILDETGFVLGNVVIPLSQQINYFKEVTLSDLKDRVGCNTSEILGRYLFLMAIGNNDYLLNYSFKSMIITVQAFTAKLMSKFSSQLKDLYDVGARKFVLVPVYPIGCSPVIRATTASNSCVEGLNIAAAYFHTQLISLVDALKQELLSGPEFVVVNSYNIVKDIIHDPVSYGFKHASRPCCELEGVGGFKISCKKGGSVCENRSEYVYFDGQHNTEAVNSIIVSKAFHGSTADAEVYPYNVKRLAQF